MPTGTFVFLTVWTPEAVVDNVTGVMNRFDMSENALMHYVKTFYYEIEIKKLTNVGGDFALSRLQSFVFQTFFLVIIAFR